MHVCMCGSRPQTRRLEGQPAVCGFVRNNCGASRVSRISAVGLSSLYVHQRQAEDKRSFLSLVLTLSSRWPSSRRAFVHLRCHPSPFLRCLSAVYIFLQVCQPNFAMARTALAGVKGQTQLAAVFNTSPFSERGDVASVIVILLNGRYPKPPAFNLFIFLLTSRPEMTQQSRVKGGGTSSVSMSVSILGIA